MRRDLKWLLAALVALALAFGAEAPPAADLSPPEPDQVVRPNDFRGVEFSLTQNLAAGTFWFEILASEHGARYRAGWEGRASSEGILTPREAEAFFLGLEEAGIRSTDSVGDGPGPPFTTLHFRREGQEHQAAYPNDSTGYAVSANQQVLVYLHTRTLMGDLKNQAAEPGCSKARSR